MFRIGQKVVCICKIAPSVYRESIPAEGHVYTVRESYLHGTRGPAIRVREISNPPHRYADGTYECAYTAEAFRPVVEKTTDAGMAILKEILERETIIEPVKIDRRPVSWWQHL